MMMELSHAAASPFVRMVVVAAHETRLIDEIALRPVATTPLDTEAGVAAANPLGKIPVLSRPEGGALYDSRVICRYLDERAGAGLYPDGRLWEVLTLEATGHGIAEAAVLMVYEARFKAPSADAEAWIAAQWEKVARGLDALETRWLSHLYGPLDMGQIAVGCALGYLDFRHDARDWRAARPGLAAWQLRFAERPAMQATAPA